MAIVVGDGHASWGATDARSSGSPPLAHLEASGSSPLACIEALPSLVKVV
jgi:hypothetical protein